VVNHTHHPQICAIPKLEQARAYMTLQQKMTVLLFVIEIHAATGMASGLVTQIQGVVLGIEI
jgi:hypothetical protein